MSTRSQKRRNTQQESIGSVSVSLFSPALAGSANLVELHVAVTGPSKDKSHRIKNSPLENLRNSLKEEITSEIKGLLLEPQRELLKLLKQKT